MPGLVAEQAKEGRRPNLRLDIFSSKSEDAELAQGGVRRLGHAAVVHGLAFVVAESAREGKEPTLRFLSSRSEDAQEFIQRGPPEGTSEEEGTRR